MPPGSVQLLPAPQLAATPVSDATHPLALHAVAATWSLWRAARLLPDAYAAACHPGARLTSTSPQPTSRRTREAWDQLLRAERADRVAIIGPEQLGDGGGAPMAALALGELSRQLAPAVEAVGWRVASVLRAHRLLAWSAEWARIGGWWMYLAIGLPQVPVRLAEEVGRELVALDRRVRRLLGLTPDWWPLPGGSECPACGVRMLRAQVSAPWSASWTVVCAAGCRCAGVDCGCGMGRPVAGVGHIWTALEVRRQLPLSPQNLGAS